MWDTLEKRTDVISYLTVNRLLLNYAEKLLILRVRTVAVCSENKTAAHKQVCAVFFYGEVSDAYILGSVCVSV